MTAGDRRGATVRGKGKGRECEGSVWQRGNRRREECAHIQPHETPTTREESVRGIVCQKDAPRSIKDDHGVTGQREDAVKCDIDAQ